MRYLIKAITAHESEQALASEVVHSGDMESPEQFEGYVQGVGDEHLERDDVSVNRMGFPLG